MNTAAPKQLLLVWWVLWASFQAGVVVLYLFLGQAKGPAPEQPVSMALVFAVGLTPLMASVGLRWGLMPRLTQAQAAFQWSIVGIALAEATLFLGLFLFPSYKTELFLMSAAGIFQYIPLYAGRFFQDQPLDR